jgi:hypothetical protein
MNMWMRKLGKNGRVHMKMKSYCGILNIGLIGMSEKFSKQIMRNYRPQYIKQIALACTVISLL